MESNSSAKKATIEVEKQPEPQVVKKTDAAERLEAMINNSNAKLFKEINTAFSNSMNEYQKLNNAKFAEVLNILESMNGRLTSLENKSSSSKASASSNTDSIETKLEDLKRGLEVDMAWIKLTLELLNKNEVIGVPPVIKGEVKTKAKQTKASVAVVDAAEATTDAAAAKDTESVQIKTSTSYFKFIIKDKSFVEKLFTNYNEFVSTNFCTHIKSLPLAKSFMSLPDEEKISEFLNHVQKNETTNSKLITLLNKNAALKEMVSQNFETWKSDYKLNVNKNFLNEE